MIKHSLDGDMNRVMISLHEKFGKLVRTGPNELSVADLGAIRTIYGPGSKFRKSDFYSVIQGHRKFDMFAERDERLHGSQRKLISRAYSMESMKDVEPYIDGSIRIFLKNMDILKGQSIDLGKWVQLFAFDVIGEITFSRPFGFMESGQDDGSLESIKRILHSATWLGQIPSFYWVHDRMMPYIGNHLAVNERNGSIRTFAADEVKSRKERGSDRKDMLSKFFAVHHEKPGEFDYDAIVSMASSNITAGSDTTSISMRAIIYYLLRNPEYKERLVDEIDSFRAQGKISDPVSYAESNGMPYLQAVIYEALRYYPSVGMSLARVVPPQGLEIDGHLIPGGMVVGVNAWVIHRNKEIYGKDAEIFRPDRWLDGDTGDMKRFFFTFGGGARLCLGKNISWMEISKMIPTLFMHFELEFADPTKDWSEFCALLVMQEGLEVKIKPRIMQV